MHDPITLYAMTEDDAPWVAALVRAAFAAQLLPTDPPASALRLSAADVLAHLRVGGGGGLARIGSRLVGSVMWSEQAGGLYVARLAVEEAPQRHGGRYPGRHGGFTR